MDFEDRLRDHLHDRTAEIHIEPEGVDVVADRVRSRRTRRTVAAAVAALAVVAGLTSFLVNQGDDTPDQVATEGIAEDAEEGSDGSDDETADAATSALATTPPGDLPDIVLPDPGTALVFTNIETDASPGGFNVWHNGTAGDIYYVLSTAPGLTWEEMERQPRYGPDTLYTWDGDRWSSGSFGDRFVTELTGGNDGILYAISTGSVAADQLEVGTSTDGGANWSWTPLEISAEPGYSFQTYAAEQDGKHLVVVHKPAFADWDEAISLAQDNGVDIDREADEIFNIDATGLSWVPDVYEVSECNAAFNTYFDEQYAQYEEEVYEPPIPYEGDLTDEEMEILRQWEEEQMQLWDERRQDAIDHMSTVPGCEEYHVCAAEQFARETELRDLDQSAAVFEDLARRAEAGEEVTDEEWMAAEEASASVWAELDDWMQESGCEVILYGDFNEPEPGDVRHITWAELGVTPPESWGGSTDTFLVEDGVVRSIDPGFESTGWLIDVRSTGSGFDVLFDETVGEPFLYEREEVDQRIVTWSSPDGETWTRSVSSGFDYPGESASLPDGTSFSVRWAEDDSNDLIRTNPDGSSDRLLLSDLAGELDTDGYQLVGIDAGPYGVVAWASKWHEPARFVEDRESDYDPDSIILYSPDGTGWGATPVPGADVADLIVGRTGAMVFLADPDFNGTDTPPQPVLFGTAG